MDPVTSAGYESISQHQKPANGRAAGGVGIDGTRWHFNFHHPRAGAIPASGVCLGRPVKTNAVAGVLLLVPGFNGSGQPMLDGRWAEFIKMMKISLYKFAAV